MSPSGPWTLALSSLAFAIACRGAPASDPASDPPGSLGGDGGAPSEGDEKPKRVVGYLPTYRSLDPRYLDLETLTHLCVAFANPVGEAGESDFDETVRDSIPPLVRAAHERQVRVLASIAGGTKEQGELVASWIRKDRRATYIEGLLAVVERYDLDGIDVDIEGDAVNEDYEPFVRDLRKALRKGQDLTAAVATKNGEAFPNAALTLYDFVNVMSYDQCSWSEVACDQASFEDSLRDLDYWTETKGVPRSRVVLGVPFYGWCWGCQEKQTALTYGEILFRYPEARTTDWIVDGATTISLNGATTIAKKAKVAKDYGGVMMWELGQDATGDDSLFRVIRDAQ